MRTETLLRWIGVYRSLLPDAPADVDSRSIAARVAEARPCASCGQPSRVVYIVEAVHAKWWLDLCDGHAAQMRAGENCVDTEEF